MKKLSNTMSSFLFSLAFIGILGSVFAVSAQTVKEKEIADFIRQVTDRSFNGLVERRKSSGTVALDLDGRFQNVMLSRLDFTGNPVAACVSSIGEAYLFFGKNLETGDDLSAYQLFTDDIAAQAQRHGMSSEEFVFYKNLIEQAAASPGAATLTIVNNDGAGEGFNDPTVVAPEGGNTGLTRGQQRLNVFNAAAAIWGTFLDSSVNIEVRSQFNPQTCTANSAVLGSAGTTFIFRDFSNAQLAGTWYHSALANKQTGSDLNVGQPDINATFNSNLNGDPGCLGGGRFYLGFDNSTPPGTINLMIVLLHEMAHGLGFSGFTSNSTGAFNGGFPDVYSTNLFDRTTSKFWNEMTNAERMASAINTNNLMWNGANIKIASGLQTGGRDATNGRLELFTPSPLQQGSSVSHWNTTATPNLLMEPFINTGLSLNLDLTPQQMRDVGWFRDTNLDGVPDAINNVTPSGGSLTTNSQAVITWNNAGGFDKNVTIELSTDGGATYPTTLATDIANSGSFSFTVPNLPTTQGKVRVRENNFAQPVGMSASTFTIRSSVPTSKAFFDFDGDRKTDIAIFRPNTAEWWYSRSSTGAVSVVRFGASTDKIAPADFTGDGKTDIAVWRESTGEWFIIRSEDNSFFAFPFGQNGDKPVPADFDGDGKADPTVFRPSNSVWYSILSGGGGVSFTQFGINQDIPLPSDFDGDGKADFGVFRPGPSEWWIQKSTGGITAVQFGTIGDKPVPADFTGDNKTDIAIYRPSSGFWFILRSEDNSFYGFPFGIATDTPIVGDYDGDGRADAAVFRASESNWYLQRSSAGFTAIGFGIPGDKPVPSAFLP
ncbi:MAG: FG-GAP-like repeat-containing protein [Pyrinomonadaceae bacterium]